MKPSFWTHLSWFVLKVKSIRKAGKATFFENRTAEGMLKAIRTRSGWHTAPGKMSTPSGGLSMKSCSAPVHMAE